MFSRQLAVVLVRPKLAANVGAVARVAKNFGVSDLRLVEPAARADSEAHRLSSGAGDILEKLRRYGALAEAVAEFGTVIATSSLRGRAGRRAVSLPDLPDFLSGLGPKSSTAFVFGPEKSGLKEEEISRATVCLRLPTDPRFPTLNLSHAVAVTLAVASSFGQRPLAPPSEEEWAPAREIEAAVAHWDRALEEVGFYDTGHRERSLRDWRGIIAGRPLSVREVAILRGVANRILVSLKRKSKVES